jgi:hydroxybutyrate-dimer hydrolase
MLSRSVLVIAVATVGSIGIGGCSSSSTPENLNELPAFVVSSSIQRADYDGVSDDLLTAGLGTTGIAAPTAPGFADPLNPTAAELRRRAIYNNYRALFDMTAAGGFGRFYGPNVDTAGNPTLGEGLIAGTEWLAYSDDGTGRENVTMMVQVPANFDRANPCIVTAPSSGSRGVYGAVGVVGEWGLKRNCAIAYTDKGTGTGFHDLQANTVSLIDGRRVAAPAAGAASNFTAQLTEAQRTTFNATRPHRFATKHAHSGQNPEADWGRDMLDAIQFAFYAINQTVGEVARDGNQRLRSVTPENTIVIASGVSNGGGVSIAAAEQDTQGLIDGVAVAMPMIQLPPVPNLTVRRGLVPVQGGNRNLLDYNTYAGLYQPCAALAPANADSPGLSFIVQSLAENRCAALSASGLVSGATLAEQAANAQARLNGYGWEPDSNLLHASHFAFATQPISVTYANAYGRFGVADNVCGFSFGATDGAGAPVPIAPAAVARLFSDANGIVPTAGVNLIYDAALGGPIQEWRATSESTGLADYAFDGSMCLRALATGTNPITNQPLTGTELQAADRVREGVAQVRRTGNLRNKPTIIVHGRADALVPVNHTSRPYLGLNALTEGGATQLRYVEVTNAQHFDSFIGTGVLAGYDTRFVPIQPYLLQALDRMYANLRTGAALPPSQVVRTTPRAGAPGAAPELTAANIPPIQNAPLAADRITYGANTVTVPD